MNNNLIFFSCVFLLFFSANSVAITQAKYQSGFQEIIVEDPNRPLQAMIWYPTEQQLPVEKVADNPVFVGENAVRNAQIIGKDHPLILISHGFGGSWKNQAWLASALSRHGYIVAAPNHPGTTTQNMNRKVAQDMLERPNDISRTLTYLLSDQAFSAAINPQKIGIVGHSYGGWTAIELIGGQFSASQFEQSCQTYPFLESCETYQQQMEGLDNDSDYFKLDKDMRDSRISAAFIFDLGLARGFTPNSLANIKVPTLVVSAGDFNKGLPAELESQYLIQHMPSHTTEYISLDKATHFSFFGICKKNAIELLKEEEIDESYICENDINQRQLIHQLMINKITSYME
ncbi:alpha/beta hydrolase family protein [Xenorhabdus bharatensis]|uniref:alpha/beta hydrolase family protein n=1 Tax=Xenorhabdus bharatensis TaxID=3136256 RepID=UPI0030F431B7